MDDHEADQARHASGGAAASGISSPVREGAAAVDADAAERPGVPREAQPRPAEGAHETEPERQPGTEQHLVRAGLDEPTPVVGMAQPPRGLSGAVRRAAYRIPETRARHWMLLMVGDRVDVLEHRLQAAWRRLVAGVGLEDTVESARRNPRLALAIGIGGLAAVVVGARALSRHGVPPNRKLENRS